MAVPPDPEAGWSFAALEAVVLETLALARARLVDRPAAYQEFLPAAVITDGIDQSAPTTNRRELGMLLVARED